MEVRSEEVFVWIDRQLHVEVGLALRLVRVLPKELAGTFSVCGGTASLYL